MSIKTTSIFVFLLIAGIYSKGSSQQIITILKPVINSTTEKELNVEGKVELPFIENVRLTVKPFLWKENRKIISQIIIVQSEYFKESIILSPGLNIIEIATLGGKHKAVRAVFLISKEEPSLSKEIVDWGNESPVIFTHPRELKVNARTVLVKGVLTDSSVKTIDIIILDAMDMVDTISADVDGKIDYKEVEVKDLQFSFEVDLNQGLNILLAKPADKKSTESDIQVKTIIYEEVNERIFLEAPILKKGKLYIKGKVVDSTIKEVRINVHALVEEEIGTGKILPKTIINKNVRVKSDGTFYLRIDLISEKYNIKSPPIITVSADDIIATKTVIKWWE